PPVTPPTEVIVVPVVPGGGDTPGTPANPAPPGKNGVPVSTPPDKSVVIGAVATPGGQLPTFANTPADHFQTPRGEVVGGVTAGPSVTVNLVVPPLQLQGLETTTTPPTALPAPGSAPTPHAPGGELLPGTDGGNHAVPSGPADEWQWWLQLLLRR